MQVKKRIKLKKWGAALVALAIAFVIVTLSANFIPFNSFDIKDYVEIKDDTAVFDGATYRLRPGIYLGEMGHFNAEDESLIREAIVKKFQNGGPFTKIRMNKSGFLYGWIFFLLGLIFFLIFLLIIEGSLRVKYGKLTTRKKIARSDDPIIEDILFESGEKIEVLQLLVANPHIHNKWKLKKYHQLEAKLIEYDGDHKSFERFEKLKDLLQKELGISIEAKT